MFLPATLKKRGTILDWFDREAPSSGRVSPCTGPEIGSWGTKGPASVAKISNVLAETFFFAPGPVRLDQDADVRKLLISVSMIPAWGMQVLLLCTVQGYERPHNGLAMNALLFLWALS